MEELEYIKILESKVKSLSSEIDSIKDTRNWFINRLESIGCNVYDNMPGVEMDIENCIAQDIKSVLNNSTLNDEEKLINIKGILVANNY